jgi:polar amino acid transport system permease protein
MSQLDLFGGILWGLMGGALTAVKIALGAFAIALVCGMGLAVTVTFVRIRLLNLAIAAYIEWMRNIPALAHMFVIYFGLATFGIRFSPLAAAILGLGLVGAAVLCDVFAAGLKSLHAGQREAALSVGMTPRQTLLWVLFPQMFRVAWPALGNYSSQLLKDTSIASAIAAPEIMFFARNMVTSTFETTLIYLATMVLYAALVLPISWGFARTERWMERAR